MLPGQCVLQFPENSTYTSDQLIRIEGAVRSNFDIWIADIYVIAGRLVDLEVLRGNESTEGQVNLWTSNVTLQDTPVAKSTSLGRFTVTPPHSVRHDGVHLCFKRSTTPSFAAEFVYLRPVRIDT